MTQAYRVLSQVAPDGTLRLENVPFQPGETVEVIVLAEERLVREQRRYPLRGTPVTYDDPTGGVDARASRRRQFGRARGLIEMSHDFGEPLEGLEG